MKKILCMTIGVLLVGVVGIKASELISSSQVIYKDNNTVTTALDELFSAVDINERLGSTDISEIGDGTVTGAIKSISSSTGNVRYNEETDMIQIYYNGTWNDWKEAGIQTTPYYLFDETLKQNFSSSSAMSYSMNDDSTLRLATTSSNNGSYIGWYINTTGYSKAKIVFKTISGAQYAQFYLHSSLNYNFSGGHLVEKTLSSSTLIYELDLTLYQGNYYLGIQSGNSGNAYYDVVSVALYE